MKKLILPIAILSLLLTACGGGPKEDKGGQQGQGQNSAGGVTEGFLCEKEGDRGQGEDGKEFPIPNAGTLMRWNAIYGHGKWVKN